MNASELLQQQFFREWNFSSRLLFYSIIAVTSFTLPVLVLILALIRPHRNSQYFPYMCGIISGNFVLLSTIFTMVVAENVHIVYYYFPGYLICKISTFVVNSASCFIHWTWVGMYAQRFIHVFFPLRSRRKLPRSSWNTLLIILGLSCVCQIWAPITITERHVNHENGTSGTYCAEHPYFSSSSKIIVLVESTITFFIPFMLTVLADISVLVSKVPWQTPFKLISADDLRSNNRSDNMKIVSRLNLEYAEKRRIIAIKRCLVSATFTLVLNLPNYVLQLIDEFYKLRVHEDISVRRVFLQADAAVYILYLLQFPLVPVNMYFLRQNITRSSRKLREKTTLQQEHSRSFQVLEMSNDRVPLSTTILSPTSIP